MTNQSDSEALIEKQKTKSSANSKSEENILHSTISNSTVSHSKMVHSKTGHPTIKCSIVADISSHKEKLASPKQCIEAIDQESLARMSDAEINRYRETNEFELALENAMAIDVPSELAETILLSQRINPSQRKPLWHQFRSQLAVAATFFAVAFAFVSTNQAKVSEIALSHIYQELDHLVEKRAIDKTQLVQLMQDMGLSLKQLPESISYAGKCRFGGYFGIHIVARANGKPVTLFLIPKIEDGNSAFSDQRFAGRVYDIGLANMVLMGESNEDISAIYAQLTV